MSSDLDILSASARKVPIRDLRPASWNPRAMKGERFKNLCRSIEADPDFLRLRPVLARLNGEIYAGNWRWLAAEKLGYESIWAVVEDVTEQMAKERALKDNNTWGDFDDDKLRDLLSEVKTMGGDIELLGFTDKDLDSLMTSTGGRGLPEAGDQGTDETEHLWGVVVTCTDEDQQVILLQRLTEEGYDVRALVS